MRNRVVLPLVFAICLFSTNAAQAQICTVTDNSDNPTDSGSLRYCVNNVISGETINFAAALNGQTITLNSANGPLTISISLTIQGPGANLLTISGGTAVQVFNITSGTVGISGVTIANGNSLSGFSGGGISNTGTLTVTNSTFAGNSGSGGGAILNGCCGSLNNTPGTLTVSNSTFFGNTSTSDGGGILNYLSSTLVVSSSTFFGNTAPNFTGGGIMNFLGAATVSNTTVSGNSSQFGGGIYNLNGAVSVVNSIVAGNTTTAGPGDDCDNCGTQSGYNLISTPGSIINPQLAPLGWYGGPTRTMIPQFGSPAIGAGQVTASDDPATDQRGFYLPSMPGAMIDLGAVQTNYLVVVTTNDTDDAAPGCNSTGGAPCSLRDAISVANTGNNTQGTDITFASGVTGTINLSTVNTPLPEIAGNLDLIGPGANLLTISGGNSPSLAVLGSIFTVNSGADVAFTGLTVSNGYCGCGYNGGAIYNGGTMTVSNTVVSGNTVVGYGSGAGMVNNGTLTIVNSTISGNNTNSYAAGGNGGGIANSGTLTILDSTVSENFAFYNGGGILNYGGTLTMTNSTVSNNTAGRNGGGGAGIWNFQGGTVTLTNSIVGGNNSVSNPGDDCDSCGTQSAYNLINTLSNSPAINPMLASLGSYGGPTQTMLPEPGSPAICAASPSLISAGLTTDQRGFSRLNTDYSGYSSSNPCEDLGAVQSNYQAVQFSSTSYSGAIGQFVSPPPVVSVTENAQNVGGVPVTLAFSGAGVATGLGPVATVAGAGATFSSLSVNMVSSSDALSATLPVVGAYSLSASTSLTIAYPTSTIISAPAITYGNAAQVTVTVSSTTGTVTGNVSLTVDNGSPLNQALSNGQAVFTIMGLGGGTHNLSASYTTQGTFLDSSTTGTLQVNQAQPTVTFTGAPATAPYESTFTVVATTNASASAVITASGVCTVAGTAVTITAPAGTCVLTANWAADSNYLPASATQSTTATMATPTITWATPAAIIYGAALTGTQLNARATNSGATVAGKFVYTPIKGTELTAGSQTLSVNFTPTNTADYTSASASVTLQVNQATPKITWAKPTAITYGTALSSTQLDASASVPGNFVYTPPAGMALSAGAQTLSATFTPTDSINYTTVTDTVTLQVNPATPTIAWTTPAAITYGTALTGTQLDATATQSGASVPGTFVYSPAAGAIEAGGSDKLSVTFTPTDTVDYTKVTASVMLQVNPATPTITWATPAAITYPAALTGTQLDATATYNGASVGGTFTYMPAKTAMPLAGSQTLSVIFTPNNTNNYAAPPSASVTLQVNQATPKINWTNPAAITYGTALTGTQLDATATQNGASVPGTFVYSPALGTYPNGGTDTLSATFTPTDATDYTTATDSVSLTVKPTTSTTTITSDTPNPSPVNQPVTVAFTVSGVLGTPTGTVTVTASTGETCSGTLTGGTGSCMLTFTNTGSPTLTAAYGGDSNFKSSTSAKVTQTVQQ